MTEAKVSTIKKALLEIEQERLKKFDSMNKVEPTYSEKYNDAIARLLKDQSERESSSLHLTYRQRIALLIATIVIAALTVTACANGEAIKNFVVEIIDNYARLTVPQQDIRFVPCQVTYIPEGYNLKNEIVVDDLYIEQTWKNGEKNISYIQSTTNASISIGQGYEIIYIDDQEIYMTQSEHSYCLTWVNDRGIFSITCSKPIPWEEVEAIFKSIQLVEDSLNTFE